jgi:hypothetical protein
MDDEARRRLREIRDVVSQTKERLNDGLSLPRKSDAVEPSGVTFYCGGQSNKRVGWAALVVGVVLAVIATASLAFEGLFRSQIGPLLLICGSAVCLAALGAILAFGHSQNGVNVSRDDVEQRVGRRTRTIRLSELTGADWYGHREDCKGGYLSLWTNNSRLSISFSDFAPAKRTELVDFFWGVLNRRFPHRRTKWGWSHFGVPYPRSRRVVRVMTAVAALELGLFPFFAHKLLPGAKPNPFTAGVCLVASVTLLWVALRWRPERGARRGNQPPSEETEESGRRAEGCG